MSLPRPPPRPPLPPLPPVNWSSVSIPDPAANKTNRTQVLGNCATLSPGNCNGHGIPSAGNCYCICDAGYASDYSNLLAPKWCVPAGSVSTARNRTVDLVTASNASSSGDSGSQNVVWVWLGTRTGMSVTIALSVGLLVASLCFLFYCYRKYKRRCAAKDSGHGRGGGGGAHSRASHYYHIHHNGASAASGVGGAAAGVLTGGGPGGGGSSLGSWPHHTPASSNFFKSWWMRKSEKARGASASTAGMYGVQGSYGIKEQGGNDRAAYGSVYTNAHGKGAGDGMPGSPGGRGGPAESPSSAQLLALGALGADASPAMAAQLANMGRAPSCSPGRSPSYSQGIQGYGTGPSHGYNPKAQQGQGQVLLPGHGGSPAAMGKSHSNGNGTRSFVNPLAHMPPPPYDNDQYDHGDMYNCHINGTHYAAQPPAVFAGQHRQHHQHQYRSPPPNQYQHQHDNHGHERFHHRSSRSPGPREDGGSTAAADMSNSYHHHYNIPSSQHHQHHQQHDDSRHGVTASGGGSRGTLRLPPSYSGGDAHGSLSRSYSRSSAGGGADQGADRGGGGGGDSGRYVNEGGGNGSGAAADGLPPASCSSTRSRRMRPILAAPSPSASAAAYVAAAQGRGRPPPPPPGVPPPPPPHPQQQKQPRSPKTS
ncbi:hypothetical protein HYH02_015041 [Chlamydomonas schloesseri]|uniref:Uncharacterized protein n=1 Tax=Chlamydomonas schloesseri TaxID=2026947 RepID=A0A835SDZ6_9CHLO|nr:hypothetical protein HYH02_015041 [Chlamydomonas schloesseri]|eukprot:KAG2425214.1 hypothetical protein HYH02_015041 [Chlamydomonas schloesseri]